MPGRVAQTPKRVGNVAVVAGLALLASAFSVNHVASLGGDPIVEAPHMRMTTLTPPAPGDSARAAAVLSALRGGLAPYEDYHRALAHGFRIFAPNVPQHVYHFTNVGRGLAAAFEFDPGQPTSLLYSKTGDSTYRLIGAMYTAPKRASLAELDSRVPLSVAQWHMHTNWCLPRAGEMSRYGDRDSDGHRIFGGQGSITTDAACTAAGGRFYPTIFGWMVHVYPFATDPDSIWGRNALHEMAGDHGMTDMAGA
jgi:hypothetical protein